MKEEVNIREVHGFKKMRDHTFNLTKIANIAFLADKKRHERLVDKKGISNTVSYEILA